MPLSPENKRIYMSKYLRLRREAWIAEHGPCRKCGATEDLEIDHVDPETKESPIVWGWCAEKRNYELAKCQVLCRQCHWQKSFKELSGAGGRHGAAGYRMGCRCAVCCGGHNREMREYRARKAAKSAAGP